MKIRIASPLQCDSIVDGEGIRIVLWTQGCSHNCEGCHNPQTHSFNEGTLVEVEDIINQIKEFEFQDGITFSGGDPFFQPEACSIIAKYAKENNLNVWCYTGFLFEELVKLSAKNVHIKEFLDTIDILIDGPFKIEERDFNVKFRGSRNQRIIDVPSSLKENKTILYEKYN